MDALGIRAILVDEYWKGSCPHRPPFCEDPGYELAEGVFRSAQPTAELAAFTHPDRFSYLVRVDRRDPDIEAVIRLTRDNAHVRALRILPGLWPSEIEAFAAGEYETVCAAACDAGLPLFIYTPARAGDVVRYALKFPALKIIVDHCGLMSSGMRRYLGKPPLSYEVQLAAFEEVLALADMANVALKWAHAPAIFGFPGYPGESLWPALRKALDRFGADRVMWASDITDNSTGETWAELLFSVRGALALSQAEREAVLGGTARKWLDWPASSSASTRLE